MKDYSQIPPEDLPFHYDREERTSQLPPRVRERLYGGPRKKFYFDRRLLIVLIDIIIVIVAFFGITAYQNGKARISDFEGCRMELIAINYNDLVLSSLKIEVLEVPEQGRTIEAAFFLEEGKEKIILDLIPDSPGEVRILRESLPPVEDSQILKVRVKIGEEVAYLEKRISGE